MTVPPLVSTLVLSSELEKGAPCAMCHEEESYGAEYFGPFTKRNLVLCDACARGLAQRIGCRFSARRTERRKAAEEKRRGARQTFRFTPARLEGLRLLVEAGSLVVAPANAWKPSDGPFLVNAIACWLVEEGYAVESLGPPRRVHPTKAAATYLKRLSP